MTKLRNLKRIIAFDVHPRSFGFAVFEGPNELLDFGARSFRKGMNTVRVPLQEKLAALFNDFDPTAVVLSDQVLRRSKRKSRTSDALQKEAQEHGISVEFVTRGAVKKSFPGRDCNKHEIAAALAQQFPILASKLPPKRKCWQSEDYRTSIFDAAALGVAYFARGELAQVEPATQAPVSLDHDSWQGPTILQSADAPLASTRPSGEKTRSNPSHRTTHT